jgi:hypothetical protein
MGPRRTNLALLIVLVAALATGGLAFAAGTGWGRPLDVGRLRGAGPGRGPRPGWPTPAAPWPASAR